jgi:hypothetical protein
MQIPPRPVMPEDAKAYPKLVKIKQELDKQNAVIFQAEKERNTLEIERDDLKGLQKLTKKAALQKQIDSKNEQIDILKTGLSGIARRYGYENVQHFYGGVQHSRKSISGLSGQGKGMGKPLWRKR